MLLYILLFFLLNSRRSDVYYITLRVANFCYNRFFIIFMLILDNLFIILDYFNKILMNINWVNKIKFSTCLGFVRFDLFFYHWKIYIFCFFIYRFLNFCFCFWSLALCFWLDWNLLIYIETGYLQICFFIDGHF